MKWSVEDAYRTLRKDPVLKKIIKATGKLDPVASKDLYTSLLTSIVSQQLSVKAADTIYSRFISLFPDKIPQTYYQSEKGFVVSLLHKRDRNHQQTMD